jgi:ubiquinone biosynthesis monooxygenase Coq7
MAPEPQPAPSPRDALTVARILKVNHAGEYGAIRIYSAQIGIAKRWFPDIVPALAEMLGHERQHCAKFLAAMPARGSRPCRVMSLWSLGGSLLGLLTALAGRQSIWVCTAAVEAAVHRHLDDQLHFLSGRDADLHAIILSIREEELAHLRHALDHLDEPGRCLAGDHLRHYRPSDLALNLGRLDAHGARLAPRCVLTLSATGP